MIETTRLKVIDYIVIIMNITINLSILQVYTFELLPIPSFISIIVFNALTFFWRFKSFHTSIKYIKKEPLLILLLTTYIADITQNIIINPIFGIGRIFTFIMIFLFIMYIISLDLEIKQKTDNHTLYITKPYLFYTKYNVVVIVICAILIIFNIIDPYTNPIPDNSLMRDNIIRGTQYFFPLCLSVVEGYSRLFGQFGLPDFFGLSHENHVINYIIIPSFFICRISFKTTKQRLLLYVSYFFVLLLTWSTTAFFVLSSVIVADILWTTVLQKKLWYIIPVFVIISIFLLFAGTLIELIQLELMRKTVEQTGSMDYTANMWSYILHPSSLFGSGNIPVIITAGSKVGFASDIGFVSFLINVWFVSILCVKLMRCFMSSSIYKHNMGCCFLYFFLHSMKVNVLAFGYPYFAFMVVLLSIVSRDSNVSVKM